MAGLLSFDSKVLQGLLDEYGIELTWKNILATHISTREELKYILKEIEFEGFTTLERDLISGLTVGEIGVLYEFSIAYLDPASRKDNGQYFTPDDVAEFMAGNFYAFPKGKWLDPCSGVGNLSWHLVNIQPSFMREDFLVENLVLSDMDSLALLIARTLFTISFQKERTNLFTEIRKNFIVFDFLSVAETRDPRLVIDPANHSLSEIPKHDYVIVNPPYLAISPADERFETAKSRDLYAYFLENIIKTSSGFISITPQSFTNASKFRELRNILLKFYSDLTIYNFDNVPDNIFNGIKFGSTNSNRANSIRAAITVARKIPEGKNQISSLIRWRAKERQKMFESLNLFLSDTELSDDYFPKVNKVFEDLFRSCKDLGILDSIISTKVTEYVLYVPSTPRYFITALKSPVSRESIKELYFDNETDLDRAYLLINSSFAYWWWRVRDGGMTLSMETLKSIPLLEFSLDLEIIIELEESEATNKVYKKNAGVEQENVKHPKELIDKLNFHIIPEYAEKLIVTAENSELEQLKFLK